MRLTVSSLVLTGFVAGVCVNSVSARWLQQTAVPDAPLASPDQYRVEFENEFVRVIRVRFGPRAKMVMHQHPTPGAVIVTLTDQHARLTAPDGTSREVNYKAGQFRWAVSTPGADVTLQSAHQEENLSDQPFEMIRIEPKQAR